jgi:hypothetical protein
VGVPIVDAPATERRDKFVDRYFTRAEPDHVVVILEAREPARYLVAIGKDDRWHLEFKRRWPVQYNFYLLDRDWGRMFVRICPYFPFSARLCLNQHHWLARRMEAEGIRFRQAGNMVLTAMTPPATFRIGVSRIASISPPLKPARGRHSGPCDYSILPTTRHHCSSGGRASGPIACPGRGSANSTCASRTAVHTRSGGSSQAWKARLKVPNGPEVRGGLGASCARCPGGDPPVMGVVQRLVA